MLLIFFHTASIILFSQIYAGNSKSFGNKKYGVPTVIPKNVGFGNGNDGNRYNLTGPTA